MAASKNTPPTAKEAQPRSQRIVTFKDGLGTGIIALGILAFFLPWGAETVAGLEFVPGERFGILTGTVFMLGLGTILAGIAVYRLRDPE